VVTLSQNAFIPVIGWQEAFFNKQATINVTVYLNQIFFKSPNFVVLALN